MHVPRINLSLIFVLSACGQPLSPIRALGAHDADLEGRPGIVAGIRKDPAGVGAISSIVEIPVGGTVRLAAEVVDERGETMAEEQIRWSTTNWSATVTSAGEVEGRAPGEVEIVAENRRGDVVRWVLVVTERTVSEPRDDDH